ncbi:MAG TPA: chloride channel protein [Gemmatimonadales bacterium]|jgi:H+/Cl- antiporter ClcA
MREGRLAVITGAATGVGLAGGFIAVFLLALIRLITNIAFHQQVSIAPADPAGSPLGIAMIGIPIIGGIVVGIMARWGSPAIRGHGIPEVMDSVLHGESRIPPRLTILKPLSAAIAIGTGGPFGAEGPIIATGGALGSLLGQYAHVTSDERKTLLAAGAAAGMAATFGSPVSAVLLAVELLLFEYRARSIVPVSLAACAATAVRMAIFGPAPVFPMPDVSEPTGTALVCYALLGAVIGVVAVGITRSVYDVEDLFERLPIHWMWWPTIGAVVVGVLGYIDPRILGVGYDNITAILAGNFTIGVIAILVLLKFIAWTVYLGSGTSGGTLAPLFTFGSGLGAIVGGLLALHFPELGIAPPVAALVGMAAMFAGASRALLTSVVFAFETTRQPLGLLPLLAGCSAAYLVARMMMKHSIMTEKLARRGALVQDDYAVDFLARLTVDSAMTREVVTLASDAGANAVLVRLNAPESPGHQGFPVIDPSGNLVGVVTRRDLKVEHADDTLVGDLVKRAAAVIYSDQSLRDAADVMVRAGVGRLPVVSRDAPFTVVGIITRSDLLRAHAPRLAAAERRTGRFKLDEMLRRARPSR